MGHLLIDRRWLLDNEHSIFRWNVCILNKHIQYTQIRTYLRKEETRQQKRQLHETKLRQHERPRNREINV